MANDKEKSTVTLPVPSTASRHKVGNENSVVRVTAESSLEREFITPGLSHNETIAKTKIIDQNELNDITRLVDWMEDFEDAEGLKTVNFWLNGKNSIGGYSSILALMGRTQIFSPSAAGVKLSKEESKYFDDLHKDRERRVKRDEDEEER